MVVLIGSPKFAMHGMLIPGLPKLEAYFEHHGRIRRRLLPKLDRHLVRGEAGRVEGEREGEREEVVVIISFSLQQSQHVNPSEYCAAWFVKCYLDSVGHSAAILS